MAVWMRLLVVSVRRVSLSAYEYISVGGGVALLALISRL